MWGRISYGKPNFFKKGRTMDFRHLLPFLILLALVAFWHVALPLLILIAIVSFVTKLFLKH